MDTALDGVLDNSFRRLSLDKGRDVEFWTVSRTLYEVDPACGNIEHEDTELGRTEGLEVAAAVLAEAEAMLAK